LVRFGHTIDGGWIWGVVTGVPLSWEFFAENFSRKKNEGR